MPIISDNFDASSAPNLVHEPISIAGKDFKGITVDSRYTPKQSLTTYVAGSKWIVNYYSQVIDKDNGLTAHQMNRAAHLQSYKLIHQLLLRVDQGLQQSQDAITKVITLGGNGTVIGGLIPNVGDVSLADVGDGREGLFEVTKSEKPSVYRDTVYNIDYTMVGYSTPELIADLTSKTIETLYFRKDFALYGQKPLINSEEMNYLVYFEEEIRLLTRYYFNRYFDTEFQILSVPKQTSSLYDPFLMKMINTHFSNDQAPELQRMRLLNLGKKPSAEIFTIWDGILRPHQSFMSVVEPKMGITAATNFWADTIMNSIKFSGVISVVYPTNRNAPLDNTFGEALPNSGVVLNDIGPAFPAKIAAIQQSLLSSTDYKDVPIVKLVSMGDYYVLTDAFYNDGAGKSILEICAHKHISCEPNDPLMLKVLFSTVYLWSEVQRFYYVPILLALAKQYMIDVN